jgi:ABC-2 type transport system permease protein
MSVADPTAVRPFGPHGPQAVPNGLGVVPAGRRPSLWTTSVAVAARTVRKFWRTPQLVVINTLNGAMFLLIFRYVFGGAIDTGPVRYVDFMIPGLVVVGVLFSGAAAAAGVAEDVQQGFFDRLRSLPVRRTALLGGRSVGDTALVALGALITTAIGFLVGFRLGAPVTDGLAALGLVVVYGFAFTWLFIFIGLTSGTAQATQAMSMLAFPFAFVSSAYVPVDSMPGWLQLFARNQPFTSMVNAVRSLVLEDPTAAGLGHGTTHWAALSLLWSAAFVALFAPLAVIRYRSSE